MSAGDGNWTAVLSGTANRRAPTAAGAAAGGASLDGSNCHGVSGEAGVRSRVSLQAPSNAHPARALRRNLTGGMIATQIDYRRDRDELPTGDHVIVDAGHRENLPDDDGGDDADSGAQHPGREVRAEQVQCRPGI